jgi:hypothetical protein
MDIAEDEEKYITSDQRFSTFSRSGATFILAYRFAGCKVINGEQFIELPWQFLETTTK